LVSDRRANNLAQAEVGAVDGVDLSVRPKSSKRNGGIARPKKK
jgi:hypothetical protein